VAFFVPKDANVIAAGAVFLRTMALSWGFIGAQFCLTGVLRASGNLVMTMILMLVRRWVLRFPPAYLLSTHTNLGMNGIWWAFPISNVAIALVTLAVYARGDWKRTRLTEPEQVMTEHVTQEIIVEEGVR
jgi:MATE family, multidrug efflux pump